ncbi:hypothetical protein B0H34DRAFT_803145 [Crassisporium funariophilum]|nr:hypothetical protein B0H34DRAFT_803145 [Crassisporium funariophilum]
MSATPVDLRDIHLPKGHSYLVIGGVGHLDSHIVQALVDRGEDFVAVYDTASAGPSDAVEGVQYYCGDILGEKTLKGCLEEVCRAATDCFEQALPTIVFVTVSPVRGLKKGEYVEHTNVDDTRVLLSICQAAGVKSFIFTSCSSAVWSGEEYSSSLEEETKDSGKCQESCNHTNGIDEEMVLAANRIGGMRTVVLHPYKIIGSVSFPFPLTLPNPSHLTEPLRISPKDTQSMPQLTEAYAKRQHICQMGTNDNLVHYSYVDNIAEAYLLVADHLTATFYPYSSVRVRYTYEPDVVSGKAFVITCGQEVS